MSTFGDASIHPDKDAQGTQFNIPHHGLTKREFFSAMALQGFLAADFQDAFTVERAAEVAVQQADALIAELNKEPST